MSNKYLATSQNSPNQYILCDEGFESQHQWKASLQFSQLVTNGKLLLLLGIASDLVDSDTQRSIRLYAPYFMQVGMLDRNLQNIMNEDMIRALKENPLLEIRTDDEGLHQQIMSLM